MKELNFETGLVTYNINGAAQVTFNPTDANFVERLFNTFNSLDEKQEAYKAEAERIRESEEAKEVFELARRCDTEMRAMIDEAFGYPLSEPLFGSMNTYAMADGLPVWANLILTVISEVDTSLTKEQEATNPRFQKYMKKWKK